MLASPSAPHHNEHHHPHHHDGVRAAAGLPGALGCPLGLLERTERGVQVDRPVRPRSVPAVACVTQAAQRAHLRTECKHPRAVYCFTESAAGRSADRAVPRCSRAAVRDRSLRLPVCRVRRSPWRQDDHRARQRLTPQQILLTDNYSAKSQNQVHRTDTILSQSLRRAGPNLPTWGVGCYSPFELREMR